MPIESGEIPVATMGLRVKKNGKAPLNEPPMTVDPEEEPPFEEQLT